LSATLGWGFCLCGAGGAVWAFCFFAGIREVVFAARASPTCFGLCAGIRVGAYAARPGSLFLSFRWHPRYAFVLQALPLCGAAPTFLCRRKEK
jgi:hypothetical protein